MLDNKSLSIFGLLAKENPNIFVASLVFGMISGLAYAITFPIILYSFPPQDLLVPGLEDAKNYSYFDSPNSNLAKIFLINCLVIYFTRALSNIGNNYLAQKVSVSLRKRIYEIISGARINSLEKIGSARIMSALNVDVMSVVTGSMTITGILSSLVTTAGLLAYLAYLNVDVFFFVLITLLVGAATYQILVYVGTQYLQKSRNIFDVVQEGVRGLIFGAKELKINSAKRETHHEKILGVNEETALNEYLKGSSILYLATGYGEMLVFAVIGITAFHLSYTYAIDIHEKIGIVMTLLYISGPVSILLNSTPQVSKGQIALRKIREVIANLGQEKFSTRINEIEDWNTLVLDDVSYEHLGNEGEVFKLEKISFHLKKGEIVYLVGGNGSGKSTLAKIISMHYVPTQGSITMGSAKISACNIESARQYIGAIFSDFYLFPSIYGYKKEQMPIIDEHLQMLGLDQKIKISNSGGYSTLLLSDGQKKRVALLTLLMEDKDIYVFDEWASDQDPQYKKMFYEKILPDLKSKNKAIVVVTHDDAYFHNADKIVFMDYGKIKSVEYK